MYNYETVNAYYDENRQSGVPYWFSKTIKIYCIYIAYIHYTYKIYILHTYEYMNSVSLPKHNISKWLDEERVWGDEVYMQAILFVELKSFRLLNYRMFQPQMTFDTIWICLFKLSLTKYIIPVHSSIIPTCYYSETVSSSNAMWKKKLIPSTQKNEKMNIIKGSWLAGGFLV